MRGGNFLVYLFFLLFCGYSDLLIVVSLMGLQAEQYSHIVVGSNVDEGAMPRVLSVCLHYVRVLLTIKTTTELSVRKISLDRQESD